MSDYVFDCSDGEPVECYEHRKVRARKTHKCSECDHPIVVGEEHWLSKGLCDGAWFQERTCLCCESARCAVASAAEGDCILPGHLWDAVRDGLREGWLTREQVGDIPARFA